MRRLYIICFVALVTIFITCYCIGYYVIIQSSRETEPARDYYEVRQAAASKEDIVKRDTDIVIEEYDVDTKETTQYAITPAIELLGLDRASYAAVWRRYMEEPDAEDKERGLVSVDVVEFTSKRIVVRKSYDPPDYSRTGNFILYAVDGKVVIYYEDFVTIYDYTDIDVTKLSIDLQREIYAGKQVKDLEELYEFLEDHTS